MRTSKTTNKRLATGLSALLILLSATPPSSHAADSRNELRLKAAFLYSFAKFIEWPEHNSESTFSIGVLGTDPFGGLLTELEGKRVRNQTITFIHCDSINDASACQLLFISRFYNETPLPNVLKTLSTSPVLTISDVDDFAENGGMIQMIPTGGKVRFIINSSATKKSSLKVSSKLLGLAKHVIRE